MGEKSFKNKRSLRFTWMLPGHYDNRLFTFILFQFFLFLLIFWSRHKISTQIPSTNRFSIFNNINIKNILLIFFLTNKTFFFHYFLNSVIRVRIWVCKEYFIISKFSNNCKTKHIIISFIILSFYLSSWIWHIFPDFQPTRCLPIISIIFNFIRIIVWINISILTHRISNRPHSIVKKGIFFGKIDYSKVVLSICLHSCDRKVKPLCTTFWICIICHYKVIWCFCLIFE